MIKRNNVDIYKYDRLQEYLKSYHRIAKENSIGGFTLNRWSKKIGYDSPRVIAMVLKGQRAPSLEFQRKMSGYLKLRGNEKKYFELLSNKAILENKNIDVSEINYKIKNSNPDHLELVSIDDYTFEYIYNWYHLVIKQLIKLPTFQENYSEIAKKLKRKIVPKKVRKSIEMLLKMGMVYRGEKDKKLRVTKNIKTGNKIPSVAIRRHHAQMLDRAKEALVEDKMSERHFSSVTMCLSKDVMPEAKQMIENFLNEFDMKFSEKGEKDKVCQINIQLFSHTK